MWGIELTKAEELPSALKEASMQKGPAIIGIPVDYSENMELTKRLGKITAII